MMRQHWSAEEIRQLIQRYKTEGAAKLAGDLGRTVDSVTGRAGALRLRSQYTRRFQAEHRASNSPNVNARFFDVLTPTVAWVSGVLYARASIKRKHRLVIKIRMPSDRKWVLTEALKCLESHHSVQPAPRSFAVEIGNSYLVRSFIQRIGYLPTRLTRMLELPRIPGSMIPNFAAGWLAARGQQSKYLVSWTGLKPAVAALAGEIQKQVDVHRPDWEYGGFTGSITWNRHDDVANLQQWLSGRETGRVTDPL